MDEPAEAGVSLIEVLIAVAIMGLAMTAILGALGTQLSGTRLHRDQSNAATVLSSAAERVKAASYQLCGAAQPAYETAARGAALPSDWAAKGWTSGSAVTTAVSFWDGTTFGSTCNDSVIGDAAGLLRLQQVTVTVVGPEGGDESIVLLKSGQAP